MNIDPVVAADIAMCERAVEEIRKDLASEDSVDRWYARERAQRRITALTEDGDAFGLLPHEEAQLATLKSLLEKHDDGNP